MQIFLLFLSMLFAIVPLALFLFVIWWLDRYDREPIWLVFIALAWGGIGGVVFALIGSTIMLLPLELLGADPVLIDSLGAVVIAPLIEEPAKAVILMLIVWSRHFDNTTDGFVYGAACGLGFGMTENFMYFTSVGASGDLQAWVGTIVIRTLYSALMHAAASSVVGAGLGFAKFRGWGAKLTIPIICLGIAMGIHALWNGLLTAEGLLMTDGALAVLNFLLFPLEFGFLFLVFQGCLWEERTILRRELKDEVETGVIPAEHLPFLASYLKRNRKSWLARGIPHDPYVTACTTLAFRKHQVRRARNRAFYEGRIKHLRGEVEALLARAA